MEKITVTLTGSWAHWVFLSQVQEAFAACALDILSTLTENQNVKCSSSCLSNITCVLLQANLCDQAWWEDALLPVSIVNKSTNNPSCLLCAGRWCSSSEPEAWFLGEFASNRLNRTNKLQASQPNFSCLQLEYTRQENFSAECSYRVFKVSGWLDDCHHQNVCLSVSKMYLLMHMKVIIRWTSTSGLIQFKMASRANHLSPYRHG